MKLFGEIFLSMEENIFYVHCSLEKVAASKKQTPTCPTCLGINFKWFSWRSIAALFGVKCISFTVFKDYKCHWVRPMKYARQSYPLVISTNVEEIAFLAESEMNI